jgi:hypothetical protein
MTPVHARWVEEGRCAAGKPGLHRLTEHKSGQVLGGGKGEEGHFADGSLCTSSSAGQETAIPQQH